MGAIVRSYSGCLWLKRQGFYLPRVKLSQMQDNLVVVVVVVVSSHLAEVFLYFCIKP